MMQPRWTHVFALTALGAGLLAGPALAETRLGLLTARANVRPANNLRCLAFDTKEPGARFKILEQKPGAVTAALPWLKVQFEDGTIGWIAGSSAQGVDGEALSAEKAAREKAVLTEIGSAEGRVAALEAQYTGAGLLAFSKRTDLIAALARERAALAQKLAATGRELSPEALQTVLQQRQQALAASEQELAGTGVFSFAKKKLLQARIAALRAELTALESAKQVSTTRIETGKTQAAKAADFLAELMGKAPTAAAGKSGDAAGGAGFKAPPDLTLLQAEKDFKARYQTYLDLVNNGVATREQVETAKSAYLKAYNIYKHLVANGGKLAGAATTQAAQHLRVVVDRGQRLIQVFDGNGELLREYPMNFGGEAPAGGGTYAINDKGQQPWQSVDGSLAAPGLDGPPAASWLGISHPGGLKIQGTPYLEGLGGKAAAGSVRMFNEDADELSDLIAVGTPIVIKP